MYNLEHTGFSATQSLEWIATGNETETAEPAPAPEEPGASTQLPS